MLVYQVGTTLAHEAVRFFMAIRSKETGDGLIHAPQTTKEDSIGKNWLCQTGVRIFVLLAYPIMGGLWDSTAHAQQFYLRIEGNPQASSTFGTTVVDGFDTGVVQTVGPLTRSNNLLSSGASGTSSSGSYNYSLQAESGHLTRIIHERFYCNRGFAAATSLDAVGPASRQAGSPRGRSTSCSRMPSSLTAPRACLAWRLRDFVTNRHE